MLCHVLSFRVFTLVLKQFIYLDTLEVISRPPLVSCSFARIHVRVLRCYHPLETCNSLFDIFQAFQDPVF